MGDVVKFRGHQAASGGYRSGRNSERETPEIRSTAITRKGGTSSHCDTALGVTPIAFDKAIWPPAAAMARFRARFGPDLMAAIVSRAKGGSQEWLNLLFQGSLYDAAMQLKDRIRAARMKAGLTLEQVGDKLGITASSVAQWESGGTRPRGDRLNDLARILQVPVAWLTGGSGLPPSADDMQTRFEALDEAGQEFMREAMYLAEQRKKKKNSAVS